MFVPKRDDLTGLIESNWKKSCYKTIVITNKLAFQIMQSKTEK